MYSDIKQLLENGISPDPLMLHGTSIESIFELANTGKLPTGILEVSKDRVYDYNKNRIFFSPIESRFNDEKYERLSPAMDKRKSIFNTNYYAGLSAPTNYLASKLNCQTAEAFTQIKTFFIGAIDIEDLRIYLRKNGIDTSPEQLAILNTNARKRKGAILEPKESILKLPNEVDRDVNTAIAVECPDGLDIEHIRGIKLLGPEEETSMKKFLDGKLEYRGFKAK